MYYVQMMGIFAWWSFELDPSSLYADDVALVLECLDVLPRTFELIQWCRCFTSLQLNLSKTLVYVPHIENEITIAGVQVTNKPVKYLGAFLGKDRDTQSFGTTLSKMWKIAQKWRRHSMTLGARVLVLKCMIFSTMTHILNTIYISMGKLDLLQKFANDFL